MIHLPLKCYLRFELDTTPIKRKGEMVAAKLPRYECTEIAGNWSGVRKLLNAKGKLRVTKISNESNRNRSKESPEYYLQCQPTKSKSFNLTGLRFEYSERLDVLYASGEPYHKENYLSKDGTPYTPNPLYDEFQMGDRFLFIKPVCSTDAEPYLDMIVIQGDDVDAWRKRLSLGSYDEQIEEIRKVTKPFAEWLTR